jgi:hypothetical protein
MLTSSGFKRIPKAIPGFEYTRNVKSSWPQTGRHSRTNYIPGGGLKITKTNDGRQKPFCSENKADKPPGGFSHWCRKFPDFLIMITKTISFGGF